MSTPAPTHEPHKIKTVRLLSFPTVEERKKHLAAAHFNVFHLTPHQLSFDMCSLGTSAFSQEQLAGHRAPEGGHRSPSPAELPRLRG